MVDKDQVKVILDSITSDALGRKKPPLGRIATIQAMVDLGQRWQSYTEIKQRVRKYTSSGGDYMFDLQRKYPAIFEKNQENLLRIGSDAYPIVAKYIPQCLKKVRDAQERK